MATISKTIAKETIDEIIKSLSNIRGWGSVEIFIQNHKITQVIEKNIIKPQQQTK